jgi:hypothetical protein
MRGSTNYLLLRRSIEAVGPSLFSLFYQDKKYSITIDSGLPFSSILACNVKGSIQTETGTTHWGRWVILPNHTIILLTKNLDFFGHNWHSLRSLVFQGPKKSRFSGPTPSNGPCNGFARIKIITSGANINNRYITVIVNPWSLFISLFGSCPPFPHNLAVDFLYIYRVRAVLTPVF